MAVYVKNNGSWVEAGCGQVKHLGAWKDVQEVWAKHEGVWKKVCESTTGIILHSEFIWTNWYGYYSGTGSISPAGATCVPDGQPAPGSKYEITQLYNNLDNQWLVLMLRGPFQNYDIKPELPFTTLTVGSRVFSINSSNTIMGTQGNAGFIYFQDTSGALRPAGDYEIRFQ